jgi:hypothetical protein
MREVRSSWNLGIKVGFLKNELEPIWLAHFLQVSNLKDEDFLQEVLVPFVT